MSETELQRKILITAYNNRQMSQAEIARRLDCSSSYVSQVLGRYDSWDAMDARIEELNRQLGFRSSNDASRTSTSSRAGKLDVEEFGEVLEEAGPIGVVLVAVVIGGYLLVTGPLPGSMPLIRWGLIGSSALVLGVISYELYGIYNRDGVGAAGEWLFDGWSDTSPETSNQESTPSRTRPAPQSLKNDLYFDRANQQCEWCGEHVDNPEVHHIEPRREGGPNTPRNLIVLCPNCHSKADRGGIAKTKLKEKVRRQTS